MADSLLDAINLMVEKSNKPIKAIAEEVGKPYTTLKRELNEFDEGAKLGAELLLPLMRCCGSPLPLLHLAERLGFSMAERGRICPDCDTLEEELLDNWQWYVAWQDKVQEVRLGKAKRGELLDILQNITRELHEDIAKLDEELERERQRELKKAC